MARLQMAHPNELSAVAPWELDFRQLDPGALSATVSVRAGQTVSVLTLAIDLAMHQRGASPDGWSSFGVCRSAAVPTWQGADLDQDVLITFGDNDGFDGVTRGGFKGHVVSIDTARMERCAEACGFAVNGDVNQTGFIGEV